MPHLSAPALFRLVCLSALFLGLASPARADFHYEEGAPSITTPRIGAAQKWSQGGYASPPSSRSSYTDAHLDSYGQSLSQPVYPSYAPQTQDQPLPTYNAPSGAFVSPPQLQADYLSPEQREMKRKPQLERRFEEIMDWANEKAGAKTYADEAKSQGIYPRRTMLTAQDKREAKISRY